MELCLPVSAYKHNLDGSACWWYLGSSGKYRWEWGGDCPREYKCVRWLWSAGVAV